MNYILFEWRKSLRNERRVLGRCSRSAAEPGRRGLGELGQHKRRRGDAREVMGDRGWEDCVGRGRRRQARRRVLRDCAREWIHLLHCLLR